MKVRVTFHAREGGTAQRQVIMEPGRYAQYYYICATQLQTVWLLVAIGSELVSSTPNNLCRLLLYFVYLETNFKSN